MIVVSCPQRAEESLVEGAMRCPQCAETLRPHGHARTRTVRGLGTVTLTVTPRRARFAEGSGPSLLGWASRPPPCAAGSAVRLSATRSGFISAR